MKMCSPHWTKMREAVQSRGMWHLVARSGEEAAQRLSTPDITQYDPLMGMHNMVMHRALECGGMALLRADSEAAEEGGVCPLCEVKKHMAGVQDSTGKVWSAEDIEHEWINGPADAALTHVTALGLMPKPT